MSSTNGTTAVGRPTDGKVRVAIVGVGNCASSLVQGVEYYKNAVRDDDVPGLMHVNLGGYHIRDIEFVAAFDIDEEKVGKDLSEAIFRGQNNTIKFTDVPKPRRQGRTRGMTHDGLGKYLSQVIEKAPGKTADIVEHPARTRRRTCSSLPARRLRGGDQVVRRAGPRRPASRFVNCIPVFIAREEYWRGRFEKAGLPIIGDDIKSQVGATILHRVLARLFDDRGVQDRAHLPAERRRQHGLHEHAGARAARVEEDLEDERRHLAARLRPRRRQRAHRPVRPRAVADRPQVGLHPRRGPLVRRRAADRRGQARGLGLARTRPASSSTPSG